jgi:hypothetical protein
MNDEELLTLFTKPPGMVVIALLDERDAILAENARLREALNTLLEVADKCKTMEIGAGGMSIEAQAARSVYLRVPVWPFEDARVALEEKS